MRHGKSMDGRCRRPRGVEKQYNGRQQDTE